MGRPLKEYPDVVLKLGDLDDRINLIQIFGRPAPVHVEIGSGKGTFLVHQARAQPDVNFIGIEWARKYYRSAVDRIGRWGLKNVRLIRTDAVTFLRDFVHEESIDCLHVYFPDPWPKKRHHKRRLLERGNMETLIRCLKRNGDIRIATDHADYFEHIKEVTSSYSTSLEEIAFPRPAGAEAGELTGTNYERKYLKDDRSIYTLALRKRP